MRYSKVVAVLSLLFAVLLLFAAVQVVQAQRPPRPQWFVGAGAQIGATIRDLDGPEADRRKIRGGAVIESVRPGGPAEKAGLKDGDILVEFDGEAVRSARQLSRIVEETPPGRSVRATYVRDGRKTDVTVTPGDLRVDVAIDTDRLRERVEALRENLPRHFNFDIDGSSEHGRLGVTVQELTPQLAEYFGAKQGVLITAVTAESPAGRAGLKAGDVIRQVNGVNVASRSELVRALRDVPDAGETSVGIVRNKQESSVQLTLEPARRRTGAAPRGRPV
jgi:serine protease Do